MYLCAILSIKYIEFKSIFIPERRHSSYLYDTQSHPLDRTAAKGESMDPHSSISS